MVSTNNGEITAIVEVNSPYVTSCGTNHRKRLSQDTYFFTESEAQFDLDAEMKAGSL